MDPVPVHETLKHIVIFTDRAIGGEGGLIYLGMFGWLR